MTHCTSSRLMLRFVMMGGSARLAVEMFIMTMNTHSMMVPATHHL